MVGCNNNNTAQHSRYYTYIPFLFICLPHDRGQSKNASPREQNVAATALSHSVISPFPETDNPVCARSHLSVYMCVFLLIQCLLLTQAATEPTNNRRTHTQQFVRAQRCFYNVKSRRFRSQPLQRIIVQFRFVFI